ncbi:MAG: hypothetical protein OEV44_01360 [Spirochaetota bacterium]|nr:hypothetical protein [Spirochaetota bacterium]
MGSREDANRVKQRISETFKRKQAAVFIVASQYAGLSKEYFDREQNTGIGNPGRFWVNRTDQAADSFFCIPFVDGLDVGYRVAHNKDYGVYLELANDRKHEAIRPVIKRYKNEFIKSVRSIYK